MTFIHGYLLGGLLLASIPVLLHLIMRQKPRRLRNKRAIGVKPNAR